MSFLAPIEGELDNAATLIPLKWLYEQLAKCKARQKVLVLDVNRYNQTFGQERPGSGEMGPKLDAMLRVRRPAFRFFPRVASSRSPTKRMTVRSVFSLMRGTKPSRGTRLQGFSATRILCPWNATSRLSTK